MLLIFPLSPILGSVGAGIGFVSALVCDAATRNATPSHTPQDGG
ncbi:hypothetical protein [Neorhodopirellula pilleata]|nr:hypothetical protein [Neorhodopirellula pilleata]